MRKSIEGIEFDYRLIYGRTDLLGVIAEKVDSGIYDKIGENPARSIEELEIIYEIIARESLGGSVDIHQPPLDDPDFRKLGEDFFLYRGTQKKLRGLWLSKEIDDYNFNTHTVIKRPEWTHLQLGDRGTLGINRRYQGVNPESFYPENFSTVAIPAEKAKGKAIRRPILTFEVERGEERFKVYAKGSHLAFSIFSQRPSYRLTSIAGVEKESAIEEGDRLVKLARAGVKTPTVIAFYNTPVEDFLFVEGIPGETPDRHLESHRIAIIEQDAQMLAALCLVGYYKFGFGDYDDKIFDGQDLYLIDTDEISDLYKVYTRAIDFRRILLNPTDITSYRKFRKLQREIFIHVLKDAVFEYREASFGCCEPLLPELDHQAQFVEAFYKRIGWQRPSYSQIKRLLTFPENYRTLPSEITLMMDQ